MTTKKPLRSLTNSRNRLLRVIDVQEEYNKVCEEGITKKYIWRKYIKDKYHISYYTFIQYLGVFAKKNIKPIQEAINTIETEKEAIKQQKKEDMKKIQPTLFGICAAIVMFSACGVPASKLASTCAELYPCKDSLVVKETTRTDTLEILDTYVEYLDTTECPPSANGVTVIDIDTVRVPGGKVVITRTVQDSTWYRIDQAHNASLVQQLADAQQERDAARSQLAACDPKAAGLPWWWLLIVSAGSFVVSRFFTKSKSQTPIPTS